MPDRDLVAALSDPARLDALRSLDLLDTPADAAFDRLARLASKVLNAPIALVTLVDADRQFFKGCLGLPEPWHSWRQGPLSHSVCQHVVAGKAPLAVSDAREHPVLRTNPGVRDLGIVAYLGIPLLTPEGHALGSFCVIDHAPRAWTPDQVETLRDLAGSVMAEIELRRALAHRTQVEELQYFRALIDHALDLVTILDADGTIRYESPALERVLGYAPDDLVGRNAFALVHPEDLPHVRALFRQGLEIPGFMTTLECRYRHRDGTWRVLEGIGKNLLHDPVVRGVVINSRDITDRQQAADELRRTQERLHHLLTANPTFIYAMQVTDGGVVPTWVSDNIRDLLGYPPSNVLAVGWWAERIHPEDRDQALANQRDLLARGRLVHQYRFLHQDGSYRWIRDELRVLRDGAGQPTEIIGCWVDITEQKRAEDALRQSDRLAALGRLAAGIGHELRSPLTAISGRVQLLAMELAKGQLPPLEALLRQVGSLQELADRMTRILQGLSTYAKPPKPEPTRLDMAQLLAATAELVGYEARRRKVQVSVEAPAFVPTVLGDRSQLMQVLVNLANNAIEAMTDGGRLGLRAAREQEPGAEGGGVTVRVDVADTGPGIPPETLARIWEPFYTTKAEGTGLGLSIVRGLVAEQPGASLSVESQPGQGTTFTLRMPADASPD